MQLKQNTNKSLVVAFHIYLYIYISINISISITTINSQKVVKQTTSNPFLNPFSNTLLTLKKLYNVNKVTNANKDGFDYLNSGYYISNQEEFNIKQSTRYQFDSTSQGSQGVIFPLEAASCTLDRVKIISRINSIRKKHQVNPLEYDANLESQARSVAIKMKEMNACNYDNNEKNYFSEVFSSTITRLSESQVVESWYETAYHYDFKKKKFNLSGINAEPMINLLWDETRKVGCGRVCCVGRELWVCDFFPVVIQPSLEEIGLHIKANKYLK